MRTTLLAAVALLALAAEALPHGGTWRGPPGQIPPTTQDPKDPPPPRGPGEPTEPPGGDPGTPGPGTPASGTRPTPPTKPDVRIDLPARPRASSGTDLGHWTFWWSLNRERILGLRALERERLGARTNRASPHFLGGRAGAEPLDATRQEAGERIFAVLLAAAEDDDQDVATGAILALGKAGDERALPLLSEILDRRAAHFTVRESAALAMGMIGRRSPEVRARLAGIAADEGRRRRTRAFAAVGLGYLGDPGALPALVRLSRRHEATYDVPAAALLGLGLLGDEMVVPDLARALAGGRRPRDDVLRAWDAAALGAIGSRAGLPALVDAIHDGDEQVRRQAMLSLGRLVRPEDEAVLRVLTRVLVGDRDAAVRSFAAVTLGEIGAPASADALLHTYRKAESTVVPYAALGLALLARGADEPAREKIIPFLRGQFAERGGNDLRGALAIALGIARDPAAVKPLIRVVEDHGDPTVRVHAAVALGLIGSDAALEPLRAALRDGAAPHLQREAALALALLGDRDAVTILLGLVKSGRTEYVRGSAAAALGRLATPETATALADLLADEGNADTTRAFAAVALGMVLDRHAVPILSLVGDHLNHHMATNAVRELLTLL